jgi:cystathionine beta-lyase/cystathionine gamma-synthase
VVGGVIVGSTSDLHHIFNTEFLNIGAAPSPTASWLLLRGLRTLPIRMERHYKTTMEVIDFLEKHSKVAEIYYPFHPSHSQYVLATRQMSGGSGLFSFRLKSQRLDEVIRFTEALKHFRIAVSWGGYESLVIPIAATGVTDPEKMGIIRLHIGLEDGKMLIDDLAQALERI